MRARHLLFVSFVGLSTAGCPPATPGAGVVCEDDDSLYGLSDPGCRELVDEDGDGFAARNNFVACCCNSCTADCNDGDADVHPVDDNGAGPSDDTADGIDQDCNGVDGGL